MRFDWNPAVFDATLPNSSDYEGWRFAFAACSDKKSRQGRQDAKIAKKRKKVVFGGLGVLAKLAIWARVTSS